MSNSRLGVITWRLGHRFLIPIIGVPIVHVLVESVHSNRNGAGRDRKWNCCYAIDVFDAFPGTLRILNFQPAMAVLLAHDKRGIAIRRSQFANEIPGTVGEL